MDQLGCLVIILGLCSLVFLILKLIEKTREAQERRKYPHKDLASVPGGSLLRLPGKPRYSETWPSERVFEMQEKGSEPTTTRTSWNVWTVIGRPYRREYRKVSECGVGPHQEITPGITGRELLQACESELAEITKRRAIVLWYHGELQALQREHRRRLRTQ